MDRRLREVMEGKEANYLLPFFWQHNDRHEKLAKRVEKIYESGARAFCVESRPHEYFCEQPWWDDMDLILSEAHKRGMQVWILDDKHFPTGYANGLVPKKYPERRKWQLREMHMDVMGPGVESSFIVMRPGDPEDQLVGVFASRLSGSEEYYRGEAIELTDKIQGDFLFWDVPEGCWRIFYLWKTRTGTRQTDYIHLIDGESVDVLIEAVYEPHYQHYKQYFGNTIAGFFSDEPSLGNEMADWGLADPGFYDRRLGTKGLALPWSDELLKVLEERLGERARSLLPALWFPTEGTLQAEVRVAYMDVLTELWRKNFSERLGGWCREHGVMYIGHIIEDMNAHARLCCSGGHYFRSLDGQDMAGIDIVLHQVMPGFGRQVHSGSMAGHYSDVDFFHNVLGQLAASHAHLQPRMAGRAMCEVFGAYGWAEGAPMMKWLMDFLLVRGVNHFVPHAFSVDYPDPDCPPHFYADGNNPQFPAFSELMRYTNRVSHLLSEGEQITDAAILYHAEAEWAGKGSMLVQEPAKQLYERQISYDITPADAVMETRVEQGALRMGSQHYRCLIIPRAGYLPQALLNKLEQIHEQGGCVLFVDALPENARDVGAPVVALSRLAQQVENRGFAHLSVSPASPLLRLYHVRREGADVIMAFNESTTDIARVTLKTGLSGEYLYLDLLGDESCSARSEDGCVPLELAPYQSAILVFGEDLPKAPSRAQTAAGGEISAVWTVERCRAADYPKFEAYIRTDTLYSMTGLRGQSDFSGFMRYTATISVEDAEAIAGIDLGRVGQSARLRVNGKDMGQRICPPYRYALDGVLKKGENVLEIEVANTLANELRDWFSSYIALPASGLMGPVRWIMKEER